MKKLLLILLCLPMIGFCQDGGYNFNKTNNYNTTYNKIKTKKYYQSNSKFKFNKPAKKHNNSTKKYIFYSQNNTNQHPFNKGLIHFLSSVMKKGIDDNQSILSKPDEYKKINANRHSN